MKTNLQVDTLDLVRLRSYAPMSHISTRIAAFSIGGVVITCPLTAWHDDDAGGAVAVAGDGAGDGGDTMMRW